MLLKSVLIGFCIVIATNAEEQILFPVPPEGNGTLAPPTDSPLTDPTTQPTPTTSPNSTTSSTTTPKTTSTTSTTPKTTTTSTTPHPPAPNTTTTTTTTTMVPPTPTTPKPKPDDKLSVNEYVGNYTGSAKICLMAKMAVQVEVLDVKNSTMINIPKSVRYSADCSNKDFEFLNISWAGVENNGTNNTISFQFFKNDSKYDIHSINATVFLKNVNLTLQHIKPAFTTSQKLSYYCAKDQALNLTDSANKTMAKVHLSSLHYQAFMNTTDPQFASVWDCDGTNTSDVVPVVVGCVLAVLVVLVLAVYLIGRRRCQSRGYLSM